MSCIFPELSKSSDRPIAHRPRFLR
jgi:hypothetical protein